MKKLVFTATLFLLVIGANAQMKSKYTNVTVYGGHDGTIDMRCEGGQPPYNYLWNDGSTDEDRINLKSGVYTVKISDQSACSVTASFNITQPEQFANANSNNRFTSEISVYPNPTEGFVNIHFTGDNANSFLVRVTDISGKIISEKQYGKFNGQMEEKIDLAKQAKGIYLFEVITERESYNTRVVLQ